MAPEQTHLMNILLALDGSAHSEASIVMLGDLPMRAGSTVRALAVLPEQCELEDTPQAASVKQARQILEARGIHVEIDTACGHPAEIITTRSYQYHCDLIVLGALGHPGRMGFLVGGIAQQVIEHATQPVLIVRAPYRGFQRVVLAVDGSQGSRRAIEYLAGFPLPRNVQLYLVHVLPHAVSEGMTADPWPGESDLYTSEGDKTAPGWQAREERTAEELLSRDADILEGAGYRTIRKLLRGDAATELVQFAQSHQADLVVSASRGLSQIKGWLLGSVSRKLVYYSGCSALIVRHPLSLPDTNDA